MKTKALKKSVKDFIHTVEYFDKTGGLICAAWVSVDNNLNYVWNLYTDKTTKYSDFKEFKKELKRIVK